MRLELGKLLFGIRPGSARRRALVKESAAPMKLSAGSVKERAAHVKEPATPSKLVARVPRVSPRPKEKAFCVCGWSEDAWDPARAYILVGFVETTNERFEVEVPSTAVMDMSGVSAGTSVSMVVVVPADNSPPTLRAQALSPSNRPKTSVSLASLNLTFDEDSHSGLVHDFGCWIWSWVRTEYADGSFAVRSYFREWTHSILRSTAMRSR